MLIALQGSHDMFDYGFFDTRFYKTVQVYEREDSKSGTERAIPAFDRQLTSRSDQPDFLLSTEMLPADEQDFEKWYRQEHLVDGSKISGWRRTERYELFNALRTEDAPKYLTLVSSDACVTRRAVKVANDDQLFLDGQSIPLKDLEKAGGSEWTQKIVGGMKKMRTGMFQKSSHHVANSSSATALSSSL